MTATIGTSQLRERRQNANDLFGLAAERENKGHIVGMNAAQVAVNRFRRMQKVAPRARRGKRRGDLLADQPRLAHAADDHAAAAALQQCHRMAELFAQPIGQGEQRLTLGANDLAGQAKLLKRAERIGAAEAVQPCVVILDGLGVMRDGRRVSVLAAIPADCRPFTGIYQHESPPAEAAD